MKDHVENCFERQLELARTDVSSLQLVATLCRDDHFIPLEDHETTGGFSATSAQIVLKLYMARNGRLDLLWSGKLWHDQ